MPGIELATKIAPTCWNARNSTTPNNAKVRETICGYAKGVDGVNTKGAPRFFNQSHW
jgi:hypothetical protein